MSGLPQGWARVALGDVADIRLGKMLDKARTSGTPRLYLRNVNVRWDSVETTDLLTMPFKDEELDRYGIRPGDLLVCEGGEPGRSAIWTYGETDLKYQKALHRVRLANGMAGRWVMFSLLRDASTGQLSRHFTGSTIAHLPREKLVEYEMPVPPAAEQERIIEALDSHLSRLDAAVASLEAAQRKLKAYRASVLKAAVEGRLVPTETDLARKEGRSYEPACVLLERILRERRRRWEEAALAKMQAAGKTPKDDRWKAKYEEPVAPDARLPSLPEGWCWATVNQLSGRVFYGSSAKAGQEIDGVPILRMGNIVAGSLDLSDLKYLPLDHDEFPELLLEPGDLLFNRTNSPELVGKSAIYRGTPSRCSFASYLICVRFLQGAEAQWVAQALNSPFGRQWVWRVVTQQVGQANVNGTKLKALAIPLPPSEEQRRSINTTDMLFSNADVLEDTMQRDLLRISRLRQSILKLAFEGRLIDQDPADEPAEALLARIRAERTPTAPARPRQKRARTLKAAS